MKTGVAFTLAAFFAVPLLGQFDATNWQWRTNIAAPARAGIVAVPLDGTLYDGLSIPPHDLRVVDSDGTFIPHAVRCGRAAVATETVSRPVRVINRAFAEGHSRAVLDFDERVLKNKLQIVLSGQNYLRKARVEGGDNQTSWETLGENLLLFDVQTPGESHHADTIVVPQNNFRYLRLTVDNSTSETLPVQIQGVNAFYEEPAGDPQLERVPIVSKEVAQDEKAKTTTLTLDLGFRNLPLQGLALEIADASFQRPYRIAGRNTLTHKVYRRAEEAWRAQEIETPWSLVSQGIFQRRLVEGKLIKSTDVTIPQAAYRYLRITIENGDDAPLDISDLTVLRRTCSVLFESRPDAGYWLYGGNETAGSPNYDFAKTLKVTDIEMIPKAGIGTLERLHTAPPSIPWSDQHPFVLMGVLGLAVLLMLWMIIPALRTRPPSAGCV